MVGAALVAGCGDGGERGGAARTAAPPGPTPSPVDVEAYRPPVPSLDELRALYAYDPAAPLRPSTPGPAREEAGVRVTEVRYAGGPGGEVSSQLVAPLAPRGRLPGVVYAHGSGAGRQTWLAEASELARAGAVALLPGLDMALTGDPGGDSDTLRHTVVAQRRGLDLLAAHPEVDPARLGFVGHSWGAVQALVLSAAEPRLGAVVAAAAGGRFSRFCARQYRPGDVRAYLDAMGRFDGVHYVAAPGARRLLLQFGARDTIFARSEVDELVAAAAGGPERRDYDAGHNLVAEPAAAADRRAFLQRVLRIG
jgi:dienelactone hydrolase